MGQTLCKKYGVGKTEAKLLMHGLDGAGKTTILYKLKLGEVVPTIHTIDTNVETVLHEKINLTTWDVGGRDDVRLLHRLHYKMGVDAILFVVDSNDRERLDQVKDELSRLFDEGHLRNTVFLILANKQDLPGAMEVREVAEAIDSKMMKRRKTYIAGCSAVTGDGLYEALDWLTQELSSKPRDTSDCNKQLKDKIISDTLEKFPEDKPFPTWSLSSYMKGRLEAVKTLLPKFG